MTPRTFAGLAGAVLFVVGAVLAFIPSTVGVGTDCGSMAIPRRSNRIGDALTDLANSMCQSAHDTRAVWVFVLAGIGAMILIGVLLVRPAQRPTAG